MIIFRFFLVVVLVSMSIYTAVVIDQHGMGLFGVFFGDMAKFGWAGSLPDFMSRWQCPLSG